MKHRNTTQKKGRARLFAWLNYFMLAAFFWGPSCVPSHLCEPLK